MQLRPNCYIPAGVQVNPLPLPVWKGVDGEEKKKEVSTFCYVA